MRIVFMGTPDFAVPSLDILIKNGFDIAGVVTTPDRPAGRGQRLSESAVKKYAVKKGIQPILQPEKLKDPVFINQLKLLKSDLFVVVAFRILPPEVFNLPNIGTFNLHASLLPQYRGAAPINWAIINGEEKTGVTTFFIDKKVDTGEILYQEKVSIGPDSTAGELHNKLMEKGAQLVCKTVWNIDIGEAVPKPQPDIDIVKKAPKIFTRDCRIDFTMAVNDAYNFIRGLSPYPAAWMKLEGKRFKIYKAQKIKSESFHPPGEIITEGGQLKISFPDGYIIPDEVQLEGKKRMSVEDFLKGFNPNL